MNNIFLIFGYGVPQDILQDADYNSYLRTVFNKIYDYAVKQPSIAPVIICCGGKTDLFKPYRRTEAAEMIRFFKNFIKERPFLKEISKDWSWVAENKSLSTLENLLNSQSIIIKRGLSSANIFIFCEESRVNRIKIVAGKIFNKNYKIKVNPIDFDVSPTRYLPSKLIKEKETFEITHSLWALKSQDNLKKHHKIFVEKFVYLRRHGLAGLTNWWKTKIKEFES